MTMDKEMEPTDENKKRTDDQSKAGDEEAEKKATAPTPTGTPGTSEAAAASSSVETPPSGSDFSKIAGLSPETAALLSETGIKTFAQLAEAEPEQIEAILTTADVRDQQANPTSWSQQAALAAAGKWTELADLQTKLGGDRIE